MAAHEVGGRQRAALVGHMGQLGLGLVGQQLARQMVGPAHARGAIGQIAGLGLGMGQQLLDALEGLVGSRGQKQGACSMRMMGLNAVLAS